MQAFFVADADDIRDAIKTDLAGGIQGHTADGVSTQAMDPRARVEAAKDIAHQEASEAAKRLPHLGLNMRQLRPGGCG